MSDINSMTVAELKQELIQQGLPVSGRKAELLQRLSDSRQDTSEIFEASLVEESLPRWRRAIVKVSTLPTAVLAGGMVTIILLAGLGAYWVLSEDEKIEYDLIDFSPSRAREFTQSLVNMGHPEWGGRMAGTAEEDAGANFIMQTFEDLGYLPSMELFSVPMFSILDTPVLELCEPGVIPVANSAVECNPGDFGSSITTFEHRIDFVLQGYSGTREINFADDVEVIDLGNGSDDSPWSQAVGKIGFVWWGSGGVSGNTQIYGKAAQNDLAALLVVNTQTNCGLVEEDDCVPIFKSISVDSVKDANGGSLPANIPFMMLSNNTGNQIWDVLQSNPDARLHIDTEVDNTGELNVRVPCGTMPGKSEELVMFGGHHDTVYNGPGAVDDTSGVATVLELATVFSQLMAEKGQPENTVRFCTWGGEEEGLWGSSYYVQEHSSELSDNLRLYLNFDMPHVDKDLDNRGNNIWFYAINKDDLSHLEGIIEQFKQERSEIADKYSISSGYMSPEDAQTKNCNSDHCPFAQNGNDVAGSYGSGSYEYHTYKDDMTRFNEESLSVTGGILGTYGAYVAWGD